MTLTELAALMTGVTLIGAALAWIDDLIESATRGGE